MTRVMRLDLLLIGLLISAFLALVGSGGCASISPTERNTIIAAVGGIAAASAGFCVAEKDPIKAEYCRNSLLTLGSILSSIGVVLPFLAPQPSPGPQ